MQDSLDQHSSHLTSHRQPVSPGFLDSGNHLNVELVLGHPWCTWGSAWGRNLYRCTFLGGGENGKWEWSQNISKYEVFFNSLKLETSLKSPHYALLGWSNPVLGGGSFLKKMGTSIGNPTQPKKKNVVWGIFGGPFFGGTAEKQDFEGERTLECLIDTPRCRFDVGIWCCFQLGKLVIPPTISVFFLCELF